MWAGGDGWMAAAALRILGFWQEADEPPTRGSGGGGRGGGFTNKDRLKGGHAGEGQKVGLEGDPPS